MAEQRIQGPVQGEYEAIITAQPFRGELAGEFKGEMDGVFRGKGEIQTATGQEKIKGERHLRGEVEGYLEGEFEGEFRMEFAGQLNGEMDGKIEPF